MEKAAAITFKDIKPDCDKKEGKAKGIASNKLASYPVPSRAWYILRAHALGLHSDRSRYHSDRSRVLRDVQVYGQ